MRLPAIQPRSPTPSILSKTRIPPEPGTLGPNFSWGTRQSWAMSANRRSFKNLRFIMIASIAGDSVD
jgi:hypothetical protein